MSATRFRLAMGRFRLALENLDEALAGPADVKAYRDSTILSFTSIYELAWNSMKLGLASTGATPKQPFSTRISKGGSTMSGSGLICWKTAI